MGESLTAGGLGVQVSIERDPKHPGTPTESRRCKSYGPVYGLTSGRLRVQNGRLPMLAEHSGGMTALLSSTVAGAVTALPNRRTVFPFNLLAEGLEGTCRTLTEYAQWQWCVQAGPVVGSRRRVPCEQLPSRDRL